MEVYCLKTTCRLPEGNGSGNHCLLGEGVSKVWPFLNHNMIWPLRNMYANSTKRAMYLKRGYYKDPLLHSLLISRFLDPMSDFSLAQSLPKFSFCF